MRFVVIALVLASLPLFISLLKQNPHRRSWAFAAIGLALFFGDAVKISGVAISWPLWSGTARGVEFSVIDMLAIALIVTRRPVMGKLPFWGLIGCYCATVVLSMMLSVVWMASFFSCYQLARVVLLFAAISGESHRPEMRSGLMTGLALGLILQAGYVVDQKATGMVQATGTLVHQNLLGFMTELALMPLLAALLGGDRRKVILLGVGAGLLVMAGGGSRGTLGFAGGGAAVLLLLSLIRGMTPAKARVLGFAVLGLAIAGPIAMMTLKERFGNGSITVLDDQRPKFETAARAIAADHPFGVGANMYVTTANTQGYAERAGVAWNYANRSASVHNAYLLARAETGWLGEGSLILLLGLPVLAGLRLAFARRQGMSGEVALGSAVAIGVIIVHNNYEYAFYVYTAMALVFINIALIAAEVRFARQQRKAGAARSRPPLLRATPSLAYAERQSRAAK